MQLSDLYNVVGAACGDSAAATIVKFTSYLYSLTQLNVADDNCTNRKIYVVMFLLA